MTWLKYGSSPQVFCHRRHVKERLRRSVAAEVLSDGQIVTELLTVSQRFDISTTQGGDGRLQVPSYVLNVVNGSVYEIFYLRGFDVRV